MLHVHLSPELDLIFMVSPLPYKLTIFYSTFIVVGTCQPVFLIRSVSSLPYNTMLTIIGQYISHGNQKTENTMTKKGKKGKVDKILHRKLRIEQHKPNRITEVNSGY